MASVQVSCEASAPFWTQTTTLDGIAYLLSFFYNQRESCYYLNIDSADSTINYATGIKLVPSVFLLQPFPLPPGELIVLAPPAPLDDSPPKLGDLADGARCALMYIEEADLAAAVVDTNRFPGFIV